MWSGVEAKGNGLVHVLDSIDDAVAVAAKAAKLKEGDYRVRFYPEKINPFQEFIKDLSGKSEDRILSEKLGALAPLVKQYQHLTEMKGLQARMPFMLEIH